MTACYALYFDLAVALPPLTQLGETLTQSAEICLPGSGK
jgi:hypothetical protein